MEVNREPALSVLRKDLYASAAMIATIMLGSFVVVTFLEWVR
jgi:hypothetical protein